MQEGPAVTYLPIEKRVTVPLPVADAFRVFTIGIARWWPLRTHSVGREKATTCVFEEGVGGRIYESTEDGTEHEWGRVIAWEPPERVVYSWYPGRDANTAQEVEVRFGSRDAVTEVTLVHRGWETLGESGDAIRTQYIGGWDLVLGNFVERARD